jgi:hypothetical protein
MQWLFVLAALFPSTIATSSDDLVCGGKLPISIVRHALRTTLMSLVIVLVSGGLIPHASMQDAVMGIERSQQPDTANHDDRAHEFSDATIVVRWSQLPRATPSPSILAMTDPFPNARG